MYFVKTPWWLKKAYPALTWDIPTQDKTLHLTFDDGPHPVATPFVLDMLLKYHAQATFFCLGKNVRSQKEIYRRILDEGHRTGNHTDNHVNGWKTPDAVYFKEVFTAREFIDSDLFRPPYGRITRFQIQQLAPTFKIIMWNVLSADFDIKIGPQKCFEYVAANSKPGSVIVFHDSEKAYPRLEYALPKVLELFSEKGFVFKPISL